MGIQVDFGTELGLVDFGDMPEQEVVATLRSQGERIRSNLIARRQQEIATEPVPDFVSEEASNRGRLASAGQSFMRGGGEAAGKSTSFLARLGEMLARSGTIIGPGGAIPMTDPELLRQQVEQVDDTAIERERRVQQDPLYQAGVQITEGSREAFQPNPAYREEFLTSTIPGSAGGMVPTIASSMAGGPVLAALQYGGAAGQSAAEEAIAAGRPDLAQTAAMVNAPIGAVTEAILGPAANIAKYARLAGGGAGRALLRGAGSEAAQEGLEQVGSNLAARGVGVDPNRELMQGVGESMAAGAFLGGLAGGGAAGARQVGQRVQQGLQDRLAPDFSLTPPADQNPSTPPPEWFNRQAEVQQAATVAIQSLDQQIAQANPQTPLEANVMVAQNAAQKMEVLNQYLEAQRNLAEQAHTAVAQQASVVQQLPVPPIPQQSLQSSAAAPLAALEAQQAATYPVAPMAQAVELAPALLNQSVIDQLRAARQQDELARAEVQAASTLPETATESTPVDQFILNRQPATQDALFVQEPSLGLLGSEASQPKLQVGLPQVGQGDAQVPAAGQAQEEAVTPTKERKKTDFGARRVSWADSPVIQDLNNLTPAEASRLVDEASGVEPTTPPTAKTELARFIREAGGFIEQGAGGWANDITSAAFQPERNRLLDAVMRDVVRNFEKDGGAAGWKYQNAWKRAFIPIKGKSVVNREMTEMRKTAPFKDKVSQIPTEVSTEEGDVVSTIDKVTQPEQQSPAELLSDSISVFVASNNLSAEDAIALKLRVAKERNPDLYEEHVSGLDEDQASDTREMVDSKRTTQLYRQLLPSIREYLSSISGPITVAMDRASVEQALASAFGSLPSLTVIEDPNHTLPNGQSGRNVAAYINLPTGQITVNAAYIDTPTRAVEAVLEEGVHSVWDLPEIQAAWAVVKQFVTKAKLDAQIARGYSPEVALEEAAVADVLAYLKENKVGGPIENFLATLWSRLKAIFGVGNQYDQSRNQILQKALEALQGQRAGDGIRASRNNGVFLSRTQAQSAISQAQEVGGDVSTIAQVAQVEGELVPRQTIADVESLASSKSKVERIASRFLTPLKAIGDLADQTWLAPFTRFSPTARSASEAGSAAELAAEAVVRADLALKAKAKAVKERLAKAEMALLEAVDNLPRAVAADSDAQINKAEGEALISEMERALANELTAARAVDVPDAEIQASILRASRILSEARKDIGSGIGSALTAIARELPAQIKDEAAILNWVEQRLNNKSLPPLMSEAVRVFLTTPLYKARTAPIQRIQLAPLIAKLRAITATKEAAKAELEQFKKDFHQGRMSKSGKPLSVSVKAFAKRFAGFEEKYKAALALSREINAKVSRAQDYVDALRLADEKFSETFELLSYRQKLEDAVKISNAGSGSLKILIGDDGQLNGTVSIPNPLTKKIEAVDLSPLAFKRQETQAKLNELALLHEQALTDPETDPYDRIQLARNLTQIQRMQDAGLRSASNLVDMIPESVPFFGGMTYIPMSRLHHDAPWFGKRLSAPNNVVTWVSGAAGKQVAGIMAATDIAAAQLERLRSDSDPSKPSQTKINDLTVTSMKAHDMDPQNAENQSRIASHFSEIISQAQRPEQRPFRVGDTNPVTNLPVLKEDIAAVEAMKQWGTAVYKVGQRAKPDSISRNIAERPVQQTEVISGKSVSRIAADYGLKLPRQADVSKLPIVRDWVNATEPQKLVILEENFPTIVTGMVTETDPDFTSRFDAVDRKIFNEAMLLGRAGNLPFQDVDSFLTWWSNQRAAETGLTPAEELADARKNLLKYVNGFMGVFGEYAGVGQKSDLTTADREVRNTPDSLMTIATADNQFTRPRGTLLAPSTFYSYDLTGIGAQEGLKTNLLNVFHHEHIKAWINVKSALKAAMETFDRKKRQMVEKGMSESKARRILQAESRKKSASIANEADYATIRNVVGHIEAMTSEMTRVATERLSVPEDAPLMRSGKAAVGLSGAVLLQSSAAIINNATGGAYGSAVIASWLNRTHGLTAGPQALAALTKNAFARIVGTAGRKVGWFGKWLQSNGAVANALADMVAEATYRRQLAEDALTVDAPDTKAMIKARLALPGSGGVVDPGRTDPVFSRILNQLQSGMGIAEVKKTVPAYLHPMVDALATGATALPEYTKRLFPSAVDRMINTTTGFMYRTWVEDPAIKKALFDHWSRKEALGGNWDSPSNPDFQFSNDDIGEALPSQSRKLLSDILAPIGSLERLSLAWYNRTKGMTPAERAAEPILTKDQADQVEFEFLKLTNQRAESTTPQVMKGKGLEGLIRSIFWQFARYGANHTAVIQRRFAKLSGGQDDENKWVAGLALALVVALLGATGLELKGIMKIFEGDARTTPTLAQTGTDPEAALRYMAASITPFLHPTGTEVVQSMVGGQTQTTPFDITQKVPVLGQATAFAKAARTAWQTGEIGYPTADFLRNALPISKFVINALMPGDAARREAARAVRAAAPSDIELREFAGGLGGKSTPMTPLIRDAINSAMEGDASGYNEAVEKAVAYQMSTGKDRKAALKSVESAIAAKDPIQSVVGRKLTPQDENRLLSRMSTKQKRSFLRARSITSGIRSRRSLLGRSRRPRSLLRQRRKKTKRTRLA